MRVLKHHFVVNAQILYHLNVMTGWCMLQTHTYEVRSLMVSDILVVDREHTPCD